MRATRTQSSEPLSRAQPRSAARRASARSPLHSATTRSPGRRGWRTGRRHRSRARRGPGPGAGWPPRPPPTRSRGSTRLTSAFTDGAAGRAPVDRAQEQLAALAPAAHPRGCRRRCRRAGCRRPRRGPPRGPRRCRDTCLVDGLGRPAEELEQERAGWRWRATLLDEAGGARPGDAPRGAAAARPRAGRRSRATTASVVSAWIASGSASWPTARGDVERLVGRPSPRRGTRPAIIRSWASSARTRARSIDGSAGRHVRGLAQRGGRAGAVARGEPVAAEPRLQDGVLEAVPPLPEGREAALRVDRRAARPAGRGRRLGRQLRDRGQPDAVRRPVRRLAVAAPADGRPAAAAPARARTRRARPAAPRARAPAGRPRAPRPAPRRGDARPASGARRRSGCRRTPSRAPPGSAGAALGSRSVTTARATSSWRIRRRPSGSSRTNPCSIASARPAARSASSPSAARRGIDDERGGRLEATLAIASSASNAGRDDGQPVALHRPLRRREQPQHAAALVGPAGEPGRDEVTQGPGQADVLELAPGGDQLLDDQRRPGRPLGHEDDDRGRGPLALDPLDLVADLAAGERREVHADGGPEARLDHREVRAQRMLAGEPVGLPGEHERQPLLAGDPRHERGERPGRGIGDVEILERDHDRPFRGDAARASA